MRPRHIGMAYDTYAATMPRHGSTPSCAHPQLPIREDQKASWQPKCWRRSKRSCDKTLEAKLLRRCERQHCSLAATLVALSFPTSYLPNCLYLLRTMSFAKAMDCSPAILPAAAYLPYHRALGHRHLPPAKPLLATPFATILRFHRKR